MILLLSFFLFFKRRKGATQQISTIIDNRFLDRKSYKPFSLNAGPGGSSMSLDASIHVPQHRHVYFIAIGVGDTTERHNGVDLSLDMCLTHFVSFLIILFLSKAGPEMRGAATGMEAPGWDRRIKAFDGPNTSCTPGDYKIQRVSPLIEGD